MNTAILLIGPTGAGKTPLGQTLEFEGLGGRRCVHVDFGQLLRQAAAGQGPDTLSQDDLALIRRVLNCGALLEDEQFHVARKLVEGRLAEAGGDHDLVVLNGLPRHVGHARDVAAPPRPPPPGGDRAARTDDHAQAVRGKLVLFAARTRPLIDHYRRAGARIITLDIGPATTPREAWEALDRTLKS